MNSHKLRLVIATQNRDKLAELKFILDNPEIELLSAADFPDLPEVVEDQATIEGNASKKALETAKYTDCICLADDTGLFIEALDGAPGVYAARFAGEDCSYRDNRLKTLELMQGKNNRAAEFKTAIALAAPDGVISVKCGVVQGQITESERGDRGFGYDSIFELPQLQQTYAEMPEELKNKLSHRALAVKAMLPVIDVVAQVIKRLEKEEVVHD